MNYSHIFTSNIALLVLEYELKKKICVCLSSVMSDSLRPHELQHGPVDWSPLGSSFHRTFQARIVEWVAISSLRTSPRRRD